MRVNRRVRVKPLTRTKLQSLELLLGPNGPSAFESTGAFDAAWIDLQGKLTVEFAVQWYAAGGERRPFAQIANNYARDVVNGVVLACVHVQQACRRHLTDLDRAAKGWEYKFDVAKAERICRFAEMLPHVKGKWAANQELIVLQPWQIFILCCVFGWMRVRTNARRFSLAYIEVGRKNAKSILAAIIGLYMFACDGEHGSEVYSGATKEDQAMEVFRPAIQMMDRSPELRKILEVEFPGVTSKKMRVATDGSRFEVVVGKPGDGASPHCGVVDEYHEHDSDTLFDTFQTGMGARHQPLELVITTAGFNLGGPCMALHRDLVKMLEGSIDRDEAFAIIYTLDVKDDWTSQEALVKPNPNYGVSIFPDYLQTQQAAAVKVARKQNVFKTKYQCVWVGANTAYYNLQSWQTLADKSLCIDSFSGIPCAVSIDLSTKRDITARVMMFKRALEGKDHYYVFSHFYIPREQVAPPEAQHYQGWETEKKLTVHEGATIDFEAVRADTIAEIRKFRPREFAFDPWNAHEFAQFVGKETKAVLVEISQSTKLLSPPMKELDALIVDGRIHHDGNPVLSWMIGNVTGHEDANENVFPRKEGDENKIDGAVAVMMALSRLMLTAPRKSVYATRGLLTLKEGVHA